ncbi:MAG: phosphoethanolamine transferase, partial [Alphaproteobacteria bacterium]
IFKKHELSFIKFFLYTSLYSLIFLNFEFFMAFWAIPEVAENLIITLTIPFVVFAVIIIFYMFTVLPFIGKYLMAVSVIFSACVLYMVSAYGVGMTYDMVVNFAETDTTEATSYVNIYSVLFVFVLGVVPAFIISRVKIKPMKWYNHILHRIYLLMIPVIILGGLGSFLYKEYAFIFRANNHLYAQVVPAYQGNVYRYVRDVYFSDPLPYRTQGEDAVLIPTTNGKPNLFVFVVGETARAENFSLYGYKRDTNKYTKKLGVIAPQDVSSCATSTAKSVPCMFSSLGRSDYDYAIADSQDNLLDILNKTGVSVMWKDNNSKHYGVPDEKTMAVSFTDRGDDEFCTSNVCYDDILLKNIDNEIANLKTDNKFIVLHTIGSHGPKYYQRYPKEKAEFKPECRNPEVSKCSTENLINTYDNTILQTDFVLAEIIKKLKTYQNKYNVALLYVSDHGESLGENGLYLHGVPFAIAPEVQTKIPMIIWTSNQYLKANNINKNCLLENIKKPVSHDNIFHSLLGGYGVKTKVKNESLDIFSCK